jgi:PKD repeat protein
VPDVTLALTVVADTATLAVAGGGSVSLPLPHLVAETTMSLTLTGGGPPPSPPPPPPTGPTYVSRTINADGDVFTVVLSEPVNLVTPPTLSGGFNLSNHAGDGTDTHTWDVVTTVPQGATVTCTADAGAFVDLNDALGTPVLSGASVTNSSSQALPTQTSAATDGSGSVVNVTFDAAVSSGTWAGFTMKVNGGTPVGLTYTGGNGTTAVAFSCAAVAFGDTLTDFTYTPGDVLAANGAALAAFSGRTVTNNVPPPAPSASFTGTPTSGTAPLSVSFTYTGTSPGTTTYSWEKNVDGAGWVAFAGTPTAQNPTENFATGTSSVRVTATNVTGSNTSTNTDYVTATAPFTPILLNFIASGNPAQSGYTGVVWASYAAPPGYGYTSSSPTYPDLDRGAAAYMNNPNYFRNGNASTAGSVQSYKFGGLTPSTSYQVRAQFYDAAGACDGTYFFRDKNATGNTTAPVVTAPSYATPGVGVLTITADGSGVIEVEWDNTTGSYAYINGLQIAIVGELPTALN